MSALASKLWAALRPTPSVSVALNCNRQLSTTVTVERRHKDFEGKRQVVMQKIQMRRGESMCYLEKAVSEVRMIPCWRS